MDTSLALDYNHSSRSQCGIIYMQSVTVFLTWKQNIRDKQVISCFEENGTKTNSKCYSQTLRHNSLGLPQFC